MNATCKCGECGYDARYSHHSCSVCEGKMMVCVQHLYGYFCIIIFFCQQAFCVQEEKFNSKGLCKNCREKSDGSQTLTAEKIALEISEKHSNLSDHQQLVTVENCTLNVEKNFNAIINVETNEVCLNFFLLHFHLFVCRRNVLLLRRHQNIRSQLIRMKMVLQMIRRDNCCQKTQ